jgi:hypothetical protein
MAVVDDYNASIFFAILMLLLIVLGPGLSKKYFPEYLNMFSAEGFKALVILLVLFVSNGDAVLSLIITSIFVVIMTLIRENNNRRFKDNKPDVTKEHFSHGPPVASCSTYDPKQSEFIGMPFYPMSDRNNFVENGDVFYRPNLDYDIIDSTRQNQAPRVEYNNVSNEVDKYVTKY